MEDESGRASFLRRGSVFSKAGITSWPTGVEALPWRCNAFAQLPPEVVCLVGQGYTGTEKEEKL